MPNTKKTKNQGTPISKLAIDKQLPPVKYAFKSKHPKNKQPKISMPEISTPEISSPKIKNLKEPQGTSCQETSRNLKKPPTIQICTKSFLA